MEEIKGETAEKQWWRPGGGGGGGAAQIKPPYPYPSLRVSLAEKGQGTHY